MLENGPAKNTDREIWRERPDDYYADSIHVTAQGAIGINCGGSVIVMPVRGWHGLVAENDELIRGAALKEESVHQAGRAQAEAEIADWLEMMDGSFDWPEPGHLLRQAAEAVRQGRARREGV